MPDTVIVAAPEYLPALQEQGDFGDALAFSDADALKALVETGANVNAADARGQTALMWAAARNNAAAIRALADSGADLKVRTNNPAPGGGRGNSMFNSPPPTGFTTLKVKGRKHLGVYRARLSNGRRSQGQRHFCKECGSPLWLWDPRWPELVHPHASAIDSALPPAPSLTHIMLGSKPD